MRDSAYRTTPAPTPDLWGRAGIEPSVADLLDDPMTALIMRRDGIGRGDVMAAVEAGRRALTQPTFSPNHPARSGTAGPGTGAAPSLRGPIGLFPMPPRVKPANSDTPGESARPAESATMVRPDWPRSNMRYCPLSAGMP